MTLQDFFTQYRKAAVGFSGGVDSSFLLWAGMARGAELQAYYVNTAFQPAFERRDAVRLACSLHVPLTIIDLDVLSCKEVVANPPDRCYYCKRQIFGAISQRAMQDGFSLLLDGTNASDDSSDRPGMRALEELSVLSPLRLCGLTKEEIRSRSREAGLFTWDKPSYACLATRTPVEEPITADTLRRTEEAEKAMYAKGFRDFRVRHRKDMALIEVTQEQTDLLNRSLAEVTDLLLGCGYKSVSVSRTARRPSL